MKLVDKYRPRTIDDLCGQPWIVDQLKAWEQAPYSAAFVFSGGTGTGKTSAAIALAQDLGVAVEEGEFGGLYQIASGEQTGESVRKVMRAMAARPFAGSGWRVLIVNEADAMTPNAAYVWLDALEDLPPQAVVIFTTNAAAKLPRRLLDRCECFAFESSALLLRPYLQELADKVWRHETGRDEAFELDLVGNLADENGDTSFRRLLQLLEQPIRAAKAGLSIRRPAAPPTPENRPPNPATIPISAGRSQAAHKRSQAALKAWATRRAKEVAHG